MELLRFNHKYLRACVIRDYMAEANLSKCVCFTCGNASKYLKDVGVDTLAIGVGQELEPNRWFSMLEIRNMFPTYFDATSGHLPIELMNIIGAVYKGHLGSLPETVYVPSGSGETVVCLALAYPDTNFVAVYNLDKATEYNENAPLNALVRALTVQQIYNPGGQFDAD